jgi:hypothetical protein
MREMHTEDLRPAGPTPPGAFVRARDIPNADAARTRARDSGALPAVDVAGPTLSPAGVGALLLT